MAYTLGPQLLETCVLAIVARKDAYGYILTQQVKERMGISESALYPVLRRLQAEGRLAVYDSTYQGRNRRYYAITPEGRTRLAQGRENWTRFRENVEYLFREDEDG